MQGKKESLKGIKKRERITRMINENVEFACRIAKRFYLARENGALQIDDYISAAFLGLCDAALRYDEKRGQKFKTFVYWRIRGEMYDLQRKIGAVSWKKKRRTLDALEVSNALSGSGAYNVADTFCDQKSWGHTIGWTADGVQYGRGSLASVCGGIDFGILSEVPTADYCGFVCPEEAYAKRHTASLLLKIVGELPVQQRDVVYKRYFEDQTFEDIAAQMGGVSKSWVCRLHSQALGLLREKLDRQQMTSELVENINSSYV